MAPKFAFARDGAREARNCRRISATHNDIHKP